MQQGAANIARGWVRSVRSHGKKGPVFVTVSSGGSRDVQITLIQQPGEQTFDLNRVGIGACVSARGQWVERADGLRELEVREPSDWQVVGGCDLSSYPLQKKQHSAEYVRTELLHLRARTRRFAAVTRIRSHLSHQLHCQLQDAGYLHVHTPLLTSSDCEGAGELFRVVAPSDFGPAPQSDKEQPSGSGKEQPSGSGKEQPSGSGKEQPSGSGKEQPSGSGKEQPGGSLSDRLLLPPRKSFFKQPTFLSVSGQLHLEAFAACSPGVYAFGPIFRADPSNTANHLSEFWMLEPELSFADLADAMQLCERLVQSSVRSLLEHPERSADLQLLLAALDDNDDNEQQAEGERNTHAAGERRLRAVVEQPFARVSYGEAVARLGLPWGADLERRHEKQLCEEYCGGRPLFLTDYPAAIKPFYMRLNDADPPHRQTVACMDLLMPGLGEVAGGSAREERHDVLQRRIGDNAQLKKQLGWYLDLRKYGTFPHAGFGIGFDRLVQFATQTPNIRDVIPFPRSKGRCDL